MAHKKKKPMPKPMPKPKPAPKKHDKVKVVMEEFKKGLLKSGGSHKKVTNPKQAIAIALSEQRKKDKKKK